MESRELVEQSEVEGSLEPPLHQKVEKDGISK